MNTLPMRNGREEFRFAHAKVVARHRRRLLTRSALLGWLLSGVLFLCSWPSTAAEAGALKVIFDTDIDGDNDDAAAAAMLHALADAGRVEILAMGVVSLCPYSPACLDAINTYYGRGDIQSSGL